MALYHFSFNGGFLCTYGVWFIRHRFSRWNYFFIYSYYVSIICNTDYYKDYPYDKQKITEGFLQFFVIARKVHRLGIYGKLQRCASVSIKD